MANQLSGTRRITIAAALLALVAVGATVVLRKSIPTPFERVGPPALPHGVGSSDGASSEVGGDASHPALAARSEGPAGALPRGTVNGRVIDAVTGKGIVGAIVVVTSLRESSVQARATTTNEGTFVLEGLRDGGYGVEVWHHHYRSPHMDYTNWEEAIGRRGAEAGPPPDGTVLRVPLRPASGVWTLRLTEGREVRGVVVDEAGQGVGGAIVRVLGPGWPPDDFGWPTDANGNFDLRMDGVRAVGAQAPGRRSRWVYIPDERDRPLRIVLRREATVRGEVRWGDGRPAAGVTVTAEAQGVWVSLGDHHSATTDKGGRFEMCVEPDRHTLAAEHGAAGVPVASDVRAQVEIRVSPGEERSGVILTLPAFSIANFELNDPAGRPLPDEPLVLAATREAVADGLEESLSAQRATTDTLGRARFAVLHRGAYTLTHERVGEEPVVLWQGEVPFEGSRRCDAWASPRTRFQVRVYTTTGEPVRSFRVSATCMRRWPAGVVARATRTEAWAHDGNATLDVLGAPPLMLSVQQRDVHGDPIFNAMKWNEWIVPSPPPDGIVDVWIGTKGELVGLVLGETTPAQARPRSVANAAELEGGWRPLEGVRIEFAYRPSWDGPLEADGEATSDAHGRFVLNVDDDGEVYVRAVAPSGWTSPTGPLRTRSERTGVLRLRRSGRIEGELRRTGGEAQGPAMDPLPWPSPVRLTARVHDDVGGPAWEWGGVAPVDAQGRWSVEGVPTSVDVSVTLDANAAAAAGFVPPETLHAVRTDGPPVVIELAPWATIRGRVHHSDGTPYVPTEHALSVTSASGETIHHLVHWGNEGQFEITRLPHTPVQLVLQDNAVAERSGAWRVERWVLPGASDVQIVVPPLGAVSIRVLGAPRGWVRVIAWEAGTLRRCGEYNVELVDNVARIEGVPTDRDLVFALVLHAEEEVATCGPLRAGGSATAMPSRPAAFFLEDAKQRAKCRAALGRLYAIAPGATWRVESLDLRPELIEEMPLFGAMDEFGPPPGRYDLVELLPNGETTILVRDIEARVPERNPNDLDHHGDDDDDDR